MDSPDSSVIYGLVILASCLFYYLSSNIILTAIPVPKQYVTLALTGKKFDETQMSRWKNTCIAFLNSIVSSLLIFYLIFIYPEILSDPATSNITEMYYANCIVFGYYLFDTFDVLSMQRSRLFHEVMLHHLVVIVVYATVFTFQSYMACVSIFMIFEINNIFLNLRHILALYEYHQKSVCRVLLVVLNIMTLIVCRFFVILYVFIWLCINQANMPLFMFTVGIVSLILFSYLNIFLFVRVIKSDERVYEDGALCTNRSSTYSTSNATSKADYF
jgi:hypothetical protein